MGVNRLDKLMKMSNFPWVLSNVNDHISRKPFVNAHAKVVAEVGDIKVKYLVEFMKAYYRLHKINFLCKN